MKHQKIYIPSLLCLVSTTVMTSICMTANASSTSPPPLLAHPSIYNSQLTEQKNLKNTHVLSLRCIADNGEAFVSKLALIRPPATKKSAKLDYGIATGHGLTSSSNCYVLDNKGQRKRLLSVSFADNYKAGTQTDWALISVKPLKGKHIIRYHLDDYLESPQDPHNTDVLFAQASGIPNNTQRCKLALASFKITPNDSENIITHNCKAISGQSGSPITRFSDGRHKLTGFHLGYFWILNSPLTGHPATHSFMNIFTKDMSEEISKKLSEIN